MKNKIKPILMTPIRRCGSHAFRLRLNFSPEFYSPYPLHIVDFMPLMRFYGDLSDDTVYLQLAIDLVGLQNVTMVKWDCHALDPIKIFQSVKNKPIRSPHMIAWEMLFQAGREHGAKVVMDKSLDNIHYANELMEIFDDLLFLNIVRDPRAQVSSMNRSIIHDFDTVLNTQSWLKGHNAVAGLIKNHPDRVLTIHFEDFLKNTELELRKICQFMGLEFLDSMLDVSKSNEAQDIAKLSALWESNLSAPISSNIDKYKKHLSHYEIEIIETLTNDYMYDYGYIRSTTTDIVINLEIINEARKKSELKKQQAWKELKNNNVQDYLLRKFRSDYLAMLKQRLLRQ
jgi:hypothetical protein